MASPSNPTGAVQDEATLRELASLGIPLISDEIYDGLVYDGARVVSALEQGAETVRLMRDAYDRRRRLLVRGLRELGFGVPQMPKGAFYALADARAFGTDSRRLAPALRETA